MMAVMSYAFLQIFVVTLFNTIRARAYEYVVMCAEISLWPPDLCSTKVLGISTVVCVARSDG